MFGRIKKLWKKEKKVMAILNIEGPIRAAGEGRFRKEGGTQEILDFLYALLDKEERLDGLLIRMDTPGGSIRRSSSSAGSGKEGTQDSRGSNHGGCMLQRRIHDCLRSRYHICYPGNHDRLHRMHHADP